ncbi:serine/threonine dehydratase [Dictyobacter vulcani]|uniref:Serine/threonine dehydratase n=2 Tax=Dictyobacter vulcani TaxID=2607529 RepID=A0A5J4KSQ5_9CHLR|nr:serine/threonine dehydratase [Dictyobacter vulcani]
MLASYISAPELTAAYVDEVWRTLPDFVRPTLLLPASRLTTILGCELTIASETLQHTGSFKFRAAYNLLSQVPHTQIMTASSGNFGQAVAYACQLLNKSCTVVMPDTSAQVKVAAVQAFGGTVDLVDVRKVSRTERVKQLLEKTEDGFWAQAYDDYRVVTGNSTLGYEIFSADRFDTLVVPIGGGGLSAGTVVARDHMGLSTEIIGAEPIPGNDAARSLRSKTLLSNEMEAATIADGARTLSLGQINWDILRSGLADIVEVPDTATLEALRQYFLYCNLKVEPTGALALGAILTQPERFKGKRVCCIVSGGNVDPAVYAQALTNSL